MRVIADFTKREDLVVIGPDGTKWFFSDQNERNTVQNVAYQRLAEGMVAATTAAVNDREDADEFIQNAGLLALRFASLIFTDENGDPPTPFQAEELIECGVVNYILRHDGEQRRKDAPEPEEAPEETEEEFDLDAYKTKMLRPTDQASATT